MNHTERLRKSTVFEKGVRYKVLIDSQVRAEVFDVNQEHEVM